MTRDKIAEVLYETECDPPVFGLTRDQAAKLADAILSLLPAMDRNAVVEECADRVENFSVMMKISDLSPAQWCEVLGRDLQIAKDVRSLKSS